MRFTAATLALAIASLPAQAGDMDQLALDRYTRSILADRATAEHEYRRLYDRETYLMAVAFSLFAPYRCGAPPRWRPGDGLVGNDKDLNSSAGKQAFAIAAIMAGKPFSTPQTEAGFCNAARDLKQRAAMPVSSR